MDWRQIYEENYKKMVKEVFQNSKQQENTKELYNKLALLTNTNKLTDFLNPGESFIISNDQAK